MYPEKPIIVIIPKMSNMIFNFFDIMVNNLFYAKTLNEVPVSVVLYCFKLLTAGPLMTDPELVKLEP